MNTQAWVASGVAGRGRARLGRLGIAAGVALLGLAQGGCALVQADWVSEDARKVQMIQTGLMVLDSAQTVQFSRSPECTREKNPLAFFGDEHPSVEKVVGHGLVYMGTHWFLGKWVDSKWSGKWQQKLYWSLTMGGHGLAVGNNFKEGISPIRKFECE